MIKNTSKSIKALILYAPIDYALPTITPGEVNEYFYQHLSQYYATEEISFDSKYKYHNSTAYQIFMASKVADRGDFLNYTFIRPLSTGDVIVIVNNNIIMECSFITESGLIVIDPSYLQPQEGENVYSKFMLVGVPYHDFQQCKNAYQMLDDIEGLKNVRYGEKKLKSFKRRDYIDWGEYFMGIALLSAFRSKDPSTQVGACIVSPQNRIVSIGYNGFPNGCSDNDFPWGKENSEDDPYNAKYLYSTHAELNAILNTRNINDLNCATIYVTLFPCNECAKAIIQCGIKHIIYMEDKYADTASVKASKRMLDAAAVSYSLYKTEDDDRRLIKFIV